MSLIDRWLLPPVCLICGQRGRRGLDCCPGCESELPAVVTACRQCAVALPTATARCGRCTRRPPAFDASWAAFAYERTIETLVRRFKFHADLAAGRVLCQLAARRLRTAGASRPQALVPVPLHWRRAAARGFNQADLIARDLSRQLGRIPVAPLVRRQRPTPAQSALPAAERRRNVRAAFACRSIPPGLVRVTLVDDVMTTGATLDACAAALKRSGVERVEVWVLARA
jgi:ComF family protein